MSPVTSGTVTLFAPTIWTCSLVDAALPFLATVKVTVYVPNEDHVTLGCADVEVAGLPLEKVQPVTV